MLRLAGTRYVVPLREGGSLPAVVATDDGASFVVKFRGAGQGPKALIAELLVARIGTALGLPIPRAAVIDLDAGFGKSEPDPEIQDILRASVGANFGLEYIPGALAFDPAVDGAALDPELAAGIVWLDAYLTNVDRTPRNTNMLMSGGRLWLIDHGAALFVHHRWSGWQARIQSPFPQISQHVLLGVAGDLDAADARLRPRLGQDVLETIVADIPDEWLDAEDEFEDTDALRAGYTRYLFERLSGPRAWLAEAVNARRNGPTRLSVRQTHRLD
jgi:hypothetical protein